MAGLETWLSEEDEQSWLGSAAGDAAADLADEADLSDLIGHLAGDLGEGNELFTASRMPRVRPVLVVLAARAAGGDAADHDLQHASELLYMALAVHDLALGPNGGRRRRFARRVLRQSASWLGGNQLLLRAIELTRSTPQSDVLDELLDTLRSFSESQALSAELVEEGHPTAALWSEHADGHTGALFSFCCRAGAQFGNERRNVAPLGRFGRHLGRMWHIAEDVSLLGSDGAGEHLLGRAMSGRPALPVAIALSRNPRLTTEWRALVDDPTLERADEMIPALRAVGGLTGTREHMTTELWHARQALLKLPETCHRRTLERLASGLCKAPYSAR